MSPPLALTDSQLDAVMRAAEPIPRDRRAAFLKAVARELEGRELGDGAVGRAIRDAAREHFDPPRLDKGVGVGKHAR